MKNIALIDSRIKAGLTQVAVASKAKISVLCYQRYEAGERKPRVDVAIRIADALGTTVEALFREEG